MSDNDGLPVIEAYPTALEVAVGYFPSGGVLRVHHPGPDGRVRAVRDYDGNSPAFLGAEMTTVVPGDGAAIGWGCTVGYRHSLHSIALGKNRYSRAAWQQAEAALRRMPGGGVVYVRFEQQERYGRLRWTAVGIRAEGEEAWTPASAAADHRKEP